MAKTQQAVEIYEIIDPRDGSVRYIGKANDTQKRFKQHLREIRRRKSPLYAWIGKMRDLGLTPTARVAHVTTAEGWRECEKQAIARARESNTRLLNVADGGDEPHCSTEQRSANAKKLNDRIKNDPVLAFVRNAKRTLGTALRQGHIKEATKEKMRECARKRPDLFGSWANIV